MRSSFLRSLSALAVVLGASAHAQTGNIAVNNDGRAPDASAILDVSSNYGVGLQQKGMLIPRLTVAQQSALGAPGTLPQGLMIYLIDPTNPGYYVVEYGSWVRVDRGGPNWDILGNDPTTSANDFFGTRDNTDLVFKTNNTEWMRLRGTAGSRFLGIGQTVPTEMVDVKGAMRIYAPPNPNNSTFQQGVIMYRPDTLFSAYAPVTPPPQNIDPLMWNGHWGNIGGTNYNTAGATANSGGWTKLENDYVERFNKAYVQQGDPTCVSGSVEIPNNVAPIAANMTTTGGLTAAQQALVSPYPHNAASLRIRHQYLILASELNVELNQLNGNPSATGGLCANQPITSIGFYIGSGGGTKPVPIAGYLEVTVRHVNLGVNDLSGGFNTNLDPGQACYVNSAAVNIPAASNGWEVYGPLSTPFVWDGTRNVLVEIAYATNNAAPAVPPVKYAPTPGGALLTASWNGSSAVACSTVGGANSCGPICPGAGMAWNPGCGTGGTIAYRPVIQFNGTVSSAPTATSSNGAYLFYKGGLIAEKTVGWGRQTTPYYAFKGPGTIAAEAGVFDNGVQLNDHVFDRAFDGAVAASDAARFGDERTLSIGEMADYTRTNRHLPTMRGRESWRAEGGFSLGDLTNQLWTTAETQALYVTQLNDRLDVLELLSTDRPVDAKEYAEAKAELCAMKDLTEADKAALVRSLQQRLVATTQH